MSKKLKGYEIARVKNYFPITTDENFTKTDISGLIQNGTIEGMGMLKERVSASNPIVLESIFDVIERHSQSTAKYVGYAIPIRNFNKVYNTTLMGYKDSIANTMGKKYGVEGKKYIQNFLTDLQSSRSDGKSEWSDKLRGHFAVAVLVGKVSVMASQVAAIPIGASTLGWKNIKSAYKVLPNLMSKERRQSEMEKIARYTPLLWDRTQGTFNSELMDIKKHDSKVAKVKAVDFFLNGIEKVDATCVGALWYAAESKTKNECKNLKPGTDMFYEQTAEFFNEAVMQTQSMYDTTQLSDLSRNPSRIWKQIFMFTTQPMQELNRIADCVGEVRAKAKMLDKGMCTKEDCKKAYGNLARAISAEIASIVTIATMKLVANALLNNMKRYEDDDDNKVTQESIFDKWIKDTIDAAVGIIPLGSNIYNLIMSVKGEERFYGFGLGVIDSLNDLGTSIANTSTNFIKAFTTEKDEEKAKYYRQFRKSFDGVLESASIVAGVPYTSMKQLTNAVTSRVFDTRIEDIYETKGTKETGNEVYKDGKVTYQELYNLLDNGERTKEQIANAVRNTLKEKDSRVEDAAKFRMSGNTDAYTEKAKEIIKDGFKQDDVVSAINAKINELSKDTKKESEPKKKGLYSTDDVLASLKNGGNTQSIIDDIMDTGKENGADKTSSIKSAVKKAYEKAYQDGDAGTREKIESMLSGLTIGGESVFDDDYFYKMSMKYSGKDVTEDLQNGKVYDAQQKINEMYLIKYQHTVSNAKTLAEKKSVKTETASGIKSSITSIYKPLYQSGDNKTKLQIIQTLNQLRAGGVKIYSSADFQRWNKE